MINSDRSGGNCTIFNDLFDRLCISNEKKRCKCKNMITGINESKLLVKHI